MKALPNIAFHQTEATTLPIEIIPLDNFYRRGEELTSSKPTPTHSPFNPHRVLFYALIVIEEGEIHHFLDGQEYIVHAGHIMLIRPQQVHAYVLPTKTVKGYIILFTKQVWESIKENVGVEFSRLLSSSTTFDNIHSLSQNDQQQASPILCLLFQNQQQATPDNMMQWLLFTTLLRVFTRFWPNSNQSGSKKSIDAYVRFNELLTQQFKVSRDAIFYASKLGMSYKTLNKICKETANQTAKQVIDQLVILEAKRMLLTHKQATQAIAYALGFDESTNFVKFFKRLTGKTPREFQGK